jgi:putative membrane protein
MFNFNYNSHVGKINKSFIRLLQQQQQHSVHCITTTTSKTAIPNTGSVARDHLANERTFLAWFRTGLALTGFGVGIQEYLENKKSITCDDTETNKITTTLHYATPIVLVLFGSCVIFYSSFRYFAVKRHLEQNLFNPSKLGILVVSTSASTLSLGALLLVCPPLRKILDV